MPLASITKPVSMKNGTASRTKLLLPFAPCWAKASSGMAPELVMKTIAANAST